MAKADDDDDNDCPISYVSGGTINVEAIVVGNGTSGPSSKIEWSSLCLTSHQRPWERYEPTYSPSIYE